MLLKPYIHSITSTYYHLRPPTTLLFLHIQKIKSIHYLTYFWDWLCGKCAKGVRRISMTTLGWRKMLESELPSNYQLNQVFGKPFKPKNELDRQMQRSIDQDDELECRCPICHGKGFFTRLEQSGLDYDLKVENWYRCQCQAGTVGANSKNP